MPISSDRSSAIQVGNIASIGADNAPTPAIGDLMEAFKSGFVTVDDLVRRTRQNVSEIDQQKTALQAGALQRRIAPQAAGLQEAQIQAAGQVLPGATELALSGQELAQQEADRQAALTSDDSERHLAAQADAVKREYINVFGEDPAKSIKIDALNPEPTDVFEVWLEKNYGKEVERQVNAFEPGVPDPKDQDPIILEKVNSFQSGFPLNSREDNIARAKFANTLEAEIKALPTPDQLRSEFESQVVARIREDPAIRTKYENYKVEQGKQKDTLKAGSPEHTEVLRQRIQNAQDKAALRAANLKAIPTLLEAQAKEAAAAPGKAVEAQAKAQGDVLAELHRSEPLKRFEPQFETFAKVDELRAPGRVPTSADDIAALYLFVKLLDPTSAVREGEVDLTKSTNAYVVQAYNRFKSAFDSKNKIVGDTARKELLDTMDSLKRGALTTIAPELKRISTLAIDRGVPLDQVFTGPYQAILSGSKSPTVAATSTPPPANVGAKRVVQNGVTFDWDGTRYVPIQ